MKVVDQLDSNQRPVEYEPLRRKSTCWLLRRSARGILVANRCIRVNHGGESQKTPKLLLRA
jgi:hypothetical protein